MSQHEVIAACGEADIIFEQLGKSGVSMAGLDAMAIGRPVIANGRPEIVEPLIGEASPICQATTPVQVCAQLERLVVDPGLRQAVGAASRRYVEKHFSADSAAQNILKRLSLATGAK
jgi:glycosyltransferase involved in cell wall biosynthesis